MSNQDEIARLNKQIDMMAGFYKSHYNDQTKKLKLQLSRSWMKITEIKSSRDKLKANKVKSSILLLTLKNSGKLLMSKKEIADILFVDQGAIDSENSKLIKDAK